MFHEILAIFFILTFSNVIESAPGIAGAPWTDEEVGLVKAKLWSIMTDPDKFIKVLSGKKKKKELCGEACWKDCDAFDKSKMLKFLIGFEINCIL